MKNMKISIKLLTGFGSIAAFVVLSGLISLISLSTINRTVTSYAAKTLPNLEAVWEIKLQMMSMEQYLIEAIASKNPQNTEDSLEKISEEQIKLAQLIAQYEGNGLASTSLMENFKLQKNEMSVYHRQIVNLLQPADTDKNNDENKENALTIYETKYISAYTRSIQALERITQEAKALADEQSRQAKDTILMSRASVFFSILAALLIATAMGCLIRKTIVQPVMDIEQAAAQLSMGNLTSSITYQSRDEFGSLAAAINKSIMTIELYIKDIERAMGEMSRGNFDVKPSQPFIGDFKQIETAISSMIIQMSTILNQINTAARQVTGEAWQVSSNAQQLASGASEQASAVEELSASIDEISKRVKHNAENAMQASLLATETTTSIENSSAQMTLLSEAMEKINTQSKEIKKIIKTIEDIAFQTNILALNAAVEAARAGETGRGFTIVAGEVRNLARKSAEAANNTTLLIETSTASIANGVALTESTADHLHKAVQSVNATAAAVTSISGASAEQATAIEQITVGLEQISQVVQQNSASSEEIASASEELSSQAELLKELAGRFRLKDF